MLFLLGLLAEGSYGGMLLFDNLRSREHVWSFMALYLVAFLAMLLAYGRAGQVTGRELSVLLGFAVLFRATLVAAPPSLSEDVYRYLWDARLLDAGVSPYEAVPGDPRLTGYQQEPLYSKITSRNYFSVYPPAAQGLFWVGLKAFGPRAWGMKVLFAAFDLATIAVLILLLRAASLPTRNILLYAWNPLPVVEFAGSGHLDSAMLLFLALALLALERRRRSLAFLWVGLAFLVKIFPLLWVPFLLKRTRFLAGLLILGVLGLGSLALVGPEGLQNFQSTFRLYYTYFEFNGNLHYLVRHLGRTWYGADLSGKDGPVLGAVFVVLVLLLWMRVRLEDNRQLWEVLLLVTGLHFVFSTVLHPWYVSWLLLLVPLTPRRSLLYWSAAVVLTYTAYSSKPVAERAWALWLEYVPFFLFWFQELGARLKFSLRRMEIVLQPAPPTSEAA